MHVNNYWFRLKYDIWQHSIMSTEVRLTTRGHPIWRQSSGPLAETASGLGAGFSTTLTENMLHHHYVDNSTASLGPKNGLGLTVTLTSIQEADKRTNQFVLLWFHCRQASVFFQTEQGHEQQHPSDHCWSSSFALLPCQSTFQYHKCTVCRVQRQLSSTEEKSKLVTSHRRKVSRGEWISPAGAASRE